MSEKPSKVCDDEFAGQGGSYRVNERGERELVERTRDAEPIPPSPTPVTPTESTSKRKKV